MIFTFVRAWQLLSMLALGTLAGVVISRVTPAAAGGRPAAQLVRAGDDAWLFYPELGRLYLYRYPSTGDGSLQCVYDYKLGAPGEPMLRGNCR